MYVPNVENKLYYTEKKYLIIEDVRSHFKEITANISMPYYPVLQFIWLVQGRAIRTKIGTFHGTPAVDTYSHIERHLRCNPQILKLFRGVMECLMSKAPMGSIRAMRLQFGQLPVNKAAWTFCQ